MEENMFRKEKIDHWAPVSFETSKYAQKAMALFQEGYNCSQSVFLAFEDCYDMDHQAALRLSSSFGGGMGRLREVCGAVSGMFMVAGLLYGYTSPTDNEKKKAHYALIQAMAQKFKDKTGSIICRELLGGPDNSPNPTLRTAEFYKKRPCSELVRICADIVDQVIAEKGI